MSWKELLEWRRNKWVKFGFWALLYLLWVIWLGNLWWILGLGIIFDLNITKKVKWMFWKKEYKEGEKHNVLLDWIDAIVFAVIVVTFINIFFFQAFTIPSSSMESSLYTGDYLFVSKLSYGPRVPQTPLTIPFTHNVIGSHESYSTLIQNKYRRLKGLGGVKRGDYVVFNFPNGDTVLIKAPADDYYALCRHLGKERTIATYGPIIVRPADKTDHYIKRCVAVAGDTLRIVDGLVSVNQKPLPVYDGVQSTYEVELQVSENGQVRRIAPDVLEKLNISQNECRFDKNLPGYRSMALTSRQKEQLEKLSNVVSVEEEIDPMGKPSYPDTYRSIFPFTEGSGWTRDNFGPLWIPKAGVEVELNLQNLPLYERIIRVYEHNRLEVKDGVIYINSKPAKSYKFKQNYYFMMGDNRHNSLDSRYWGFVPEDHVVGKPFVIWFSSDKNKSFPKNIRWRRLFKFV